MKKKTKKAVTRAFMVALLLCSVFVVISILMENGQERQPHSPMNDAVNNYKPLVEKYASTFGVTEHTDVLLAMMMQESRGHGNDPMQSSESYCGQVGCINDPELSIKQGVYYFSKTLSEAHGDLELAIQSYNFGKGFINYVHKQNATYTQEIAIDFSKKMYENAEDKSIYTCLRKEAKQYNACYGDIYYVRDVMKYKKLITGNTVDSNDEH